MAQARSVSRDGTKTATSLIATSRERGAQQSLRLGLRFGDWLCRIAAPPLASLVAPTVDRGDPDGDGADVPWLRYEGDSANATSHFGLAVGEDGIYELVLARAATPIDTERCYLSGRLDEDQLAAIDALFTTEPVEAGGFDGTEPGEAGPSRRVRFHARAGAIDDHHHEPRPGRSRRAPVATLVKTLDGIVTELVARGEFCSDEDRAVARDGEWTLSLEE